MPSEGIMARIYLYCLLTLLAAPVVNTACGEDAKPNSEDEPNSQLMAEYVRRAATYSIELLDSETQLKLESRPVFNWFNVDRMGDPHVYQGAVFVWTDRGRPEVVGAIFSVTRGHNAPEIYHEFHSLSTQRLRAKMNGITVWSPSRAGVDPKPFAKTPQVSPDPTGRLVQMQQLAARFSGYSFKKGRFELELLQQPLHRATGKHPDVHDGALFALKYTTGRNPEILLVIETREVSGEWKWHYSICRFTGFQSWISLDDQVVWSLEVDGFFAAAGINDIYRTLRDVDFTMRPAP